MELRLCLGLMLLLGWANAQDPAFPENSTEKEQWPNLEIVNYLPFSCKPETLKSNIYSTSVNELRPSDVKFVASIGIKGTSPFPSTVGVIEKLNRIEESQELCLGVGTDIIRFFNSIVLKPLCISTREITSWTDAEYLWAQAVELVKNMKENEQLDFERDWKLINVFIGNANECYLCPVNGQNSFVTSTMNKLTKTLDYLYLEVPRSFVNLVDLTDILQFSGLPKMGTQNGNNTLSCVCSEEMVQYKDFALRSYQETWERLLASSKYNQEESFALVLQPFFYETEWSPRLMDQSPQDPTDLGVHLWNSMERPYLFTYRNSNYQPKLTLTYPALTLKQVSIECPDKTPSWTIPWSVHKLKPADIKVLAAVGDTLMADSGNHLRPQNLNSALNGYQGRSWRSRDETPESTITLPNILRQFNPKLISYFLGHENKYSIGDRLKQSVPGVISMDMSNQVKDMIIKMKHDKRMNYRNDWKLLTMFIGSNDLCHSCTDELIFSPENFRNNIQHALDILHKEVPRMIVNLVSPLEMISMRAIYMERGNNCSQDQLMKLCPCVMKFDKDSQELAQVARYNKKYQELIEVMVDSRRYHTRDDFTVVLQPFLERFEMPRTEEGLPDLTYFDLDCFHFSQKTLGHVASALWNNMLEPVGQKSRRHNFTGDIVFMCPTQKQPFLRTRKNSMQIYVNRLSCNDKTRSLRKPKEVNSVRPADIDAIGAIGDFDIVGKGIGAVKSDVSSYSVEYRGNSFCTGGSGRVDSDITLANILREFNTNIQGFSTGNGDQDSNTAHCNQAVSGALSRTLKDQSKSLISKLQQTPINFHTDWKLITVMIGYKDLCEFCKQKTGSSAADFVKNVREALDYLQENMPRALVNLLHFIDPMVRRHAFLSQTKNCNQIDRQQCPCIYSPKRGSHEIVTLEEMAITYKNSLNNLIWSGRYDKKDDFTVVLQPFLQTVVNPISSDGVSDIGFFSASCLYFNKLAHKKLASALWGNMFEELGKKTEVFDFQKNYSIPCPGDNVVYPYMRTKKNSKYDYPKHIKELEWGSDISCDPGKTSESISSVHQLRPSNIRVVASLGDWVTSGWASSPYNYDIHQNWRGMSWSTGQQKPLKKHTTLSNILQFFNPSITGVSPGSSPELAGLNVAEKEARARNLPGQATKLVKLMEANKEINFNNDWKLITIFIGINDLCDYCNNQNPKAEQLFFQSINDTLNIFYKKVQKVFINLIEVMDVVSFFDKRGGKCSNMPLQCPCFSTSNIKIKKKLQEKNLQFQVGLSKYTFSNEFEGRNDFAVISQPFLRESDLPRDSEGNSDLRYFSSDCLHFSALMQNELSVALWNNMLEPVGLKSTKHDFRYSREKLKCPSFLKPFIFTGKNSEGIFKHWIVISFIMLACFIVIITTVLLCRRLIQKRNAQH